MCDRGGGREGKNHNKTVKRSAEKKPNPFRKSENAATCTTTVPAPPLFGRRSCPVQGTGPDDPLVSAGGIIDCGSNLIARPLQRDQSRMLSRAFDVGVDAIISFTTDFDRVEEVVALAKEYPGRVYSAYGLHPDNVRKGLKENYLVTKMKELRDMAQSAECVAIFAGLDLSRDVSSHFAQHKLLSEQLTLAGEFGLPVLLTSVEATESLCEAITAWRSAAPDVATCRCAILNFLGSADDLSRYLAADVDCYIAVSGIVCDTSPAAAVLRSLVPQIPLARILVASMAPLHTPQTIPDAFIRQARNEPANLPYLLQCLVEAYGNGMTVNSLCQLLYDNACCFYGVSPVAEEAAPALVPASASVSVEEASPVVIAKEDVLVRDGAGGDVGAATRDTSQLSSEIVYRCRGCRFVLCSERDVMPHDSLSGAMLSGAVLNDDGDVGVSTWREAKGRDVHLSSTTRCGAHLISRQPWMAACLTNGVSEGALSCPTCRAKIGQFSLVGLKCSCGLMITPGFKLKKGRIDSVLSGETSGAEAVRLSAQLALDDDVDDDEVSSSDSDDGKNKKQRRRKLQGNKNRQNLSEYRNKGGAKGVVGKKDKEKDKEKDVVVESDDSNA